MIYPFINLPQVEMVGHY